MDKLEKKHCAIGIYGINGAGKSTIAKSIFNQFLFSEVQSTDNLLKIFRYNNPRNPYNRVYSYTAWNIIGEKNAKNIVFGFKNYRENIKPYINTLVERVKKEQFTLIIEGVHFDPSIIDNQDVPVIPVLLTLQNEEIHRKRIKEKASGRKELEERLLSEIQTIRIIQDFLISEGKKYGAIILDTCSSSITTTVNDLLKNTNEYL